MATEGKTIQEKLDAHPVYIYGTVFVLSLSAGFGLGYEFKSMVDRQPDPKAPVVEQRNITPEISPSTARQDTEDSGQSPARGNTTPSNANNATVFNPTPTSDDKPAGNTANPVDFKPITKEDGPLSITLKSINLKNTTLEFVFAVRNTESKSIKVGVGFFGRTKVFIDGEVYTPSRFELAGKKYSKNDLITAEFPGAETLRAKIIFEEVPERSEPSTLETDYYTLGDSYQSGTQVFKLL